MTGDNSPTVRPISRDTAARILTVIAEKLRVDEGQLRGDYTLEEIGLDSLTTAEVVLGVEKALGVRVNLDAESEAFSRDTLLEEFIALVVRMAGRAS